jgi:hypothetical protein
MARPPDNRGADPDRFFVCCSPIDPSRGSRRQRRRPDHRFLSRETFQETLRGWGVNDDATLVLYED